jgi:hypothetical protein
MGLKISVDMRGLNKLDELSKLAMQEAVKLESEAVAEAVRVRTPRSARNDTGWVHLQDTIEAEKTGDYSAEVHDGKDYGVHVEFGSKGRSGVGMFTQAFEEGQQRFPERVREWLLWAAQQAAKEAGIG